MATCGMCSGFTWTQPIRRTSSSHASWNVTRMDMSDLIALVAANPGRAPVAFFGVSSAGSCRLAELARLGGSGV